MTASCATAIGIVIQLIGAAYLVGQSFRTSRKLRKYKSTPVTYDSLGTTIDNLGASVEQLAHEIGSQFKQQLVGFAFVALGSGLQLYAMAGA